MVLLLDAKVAKKVATIVYFFDISVHSGCFSSFFYFLSVSLRLEKITNISDEENKILVRIALRAGLL